MPEPPRVTLEVPPWAWAMLREARVARLATADASGTPHLVPVCFVFDGGVVWTAIDAKPKSKRALRRVRNLAENQRTSLLIDHYEEDWRELRWVMVHGRAELLTGEAAAPALERLREKYPQYREVEVGPEAIRLVPERIVAWAASTGAVSGADDTASEGSESHHSQS